MKFLTAEEIRRKYQNDKIVSYALKKQMENIDKQAKEGYVECPLIQTISYYKNIKDNSIIFDIQKLYECENFDEENYTFCSKNVSSEVIEHFNTLNYKVIKRNGNPFLTWAKNVIK